MMAGRNDAAIAGALHAMAHALGQAQANAIHQDPTEPVERRLDHFMRNNPPTFKGRFDPEGAQTWLQGIEKIFRAVVTTDEQKVRLATHMLVKEAEWWWTSARRRLEANGEVVSWERFKREFLGKYFPEDLRNKKEVEFLQLKQGSMSIADCAAKFEELSRFCPFINAKEAMVS